VVHICYSCNILFASARKLLNGFLVRASGKQDQALPNDAGRVNFPKRKRAIIHSSKHPTEKDPKIGAGLIS